MPTKRKRLLEKLNGKFYPTAIGSLPYTDTSVACRKVFELFKDIPFWPQLVKRRFLENMYAQFSEGFPGLVINEDRRTMFVDISKDISGQVQNVYERFLSNDVESFFISSEYANGLYGFSALLQDAALGFKPTFLKGQITGPISFGLTVTDEKKRAILYNTELKEVLIKTLAMKARWQIRKLKDAHSQIIIFVDEPYLVSIGSSYVSLNREEALSNLKEIIDAIHQEGALCGIHCCGNTDWGFVLGTDIDILSFDAYDYFDTLLLYTNELKNFFDRGGVLAWGLVPSSSQILNVNVKMLSERFNKSILMFQQKKFDTEMVKDRVIITPSCGCGSLEVEIAEDVLLKTVELSNTLRGA